MMKILIYSFFLLSCILSQSALAQEQPYQPINWKTLTGRPEKMTACQLSPSFINSASTGVLLDAILSNPMLYLDRPIEGDDTWWHVWFEKEFYALDSLYSRPDCSSIIIERYRDDNPRETSKAKSKDQLLLGKYKMQYLERLIVKAYEKSALSQKEINQVIIALQENIEKIDSGQKAHYRKSDLALCYQSLVKILAAENSGNDNSSMFQKMENLNKIEILEKKSIINEAAMNYLSATN